MSIDRRKAILTLMGAYAAMASGQESTDLKTGLVTYGATALINPPGAIVFKLDSFTGFTFSHKEASITLTPQEVWEALGGAE